MTAAAFPERYEKNLPPSSRAPTALTYAIASLPSTSYHLYRRRAAGAACGLLSLSSVFPSLPDVVTLRLSWARFLAASMKASHGTPFTVRSVISRDVNSSSVERFLVQHGTPVRHNIEFLTGSLSWSLGTQQGCSYWQTKRRLVPSGAKIGRVCGFEVSAPNMQRTQQMFLRILVAIVCVCRDISLVHFNFRDLSEAHSFVTLFCAGDSLSKSPFCYGCCGGLFHTFNVQPQVGELRSRAAAWNCCGGT